MRCIKCGGKMVKGAKFCSECGQTIDVQPGKESNSKNKESNNKNKKKPLWMKILLTLLIVLVVITFFISGLLFYLHNNEYETIFKQLSIEDYFREEKAKNITEVDANNIEITIPQDVINTALNEYLNNIDLPERFSIKSAYLDSRKERIYINTSVYGVNIPLSVGIETEIDKRDIQIELFNIKLGNKGFDVPAFIENNILNNYLKKDMLKINLDDYHVPELISVEKIEYKRNEVIVRVAVSEEILKKELVQLSQSANEEIIDAFKKSTSPSRIKAAELIEEVQFLDDEDIQSIIRDILEDKELLESLLIVTDEGVIDSIFKEYGEYINDLDKAYILEEKGVIIADKIASYSRLILEYIGYDIEDYIFLIYRNNPYMLDLDYEITIQDIIDNYDLNIPESIEGNMNLIYDFENKRFNLANKLSENEYMIVDDTSFYYMNSDDYINKYVYPYTGESHYLSKNNNDRKAIESKISSYFGTDEVYVRYMKADDKYAFVIASSKDDYQNYESFALGRNTDSTWYIINSGIDNFNEFNTNHPEFNVKLLTDMHLTTILYQLTEDNKYNMLDYLNYLGIITDMDSVSVDYGSYDGNYIAIKLSNGEEYVCSIDYSYFDEVYEKDEAINIWWDISELILLQD